MLTAAMLWRHTHTHARTHPSTHQPTPHTYTHTHTRARARTHSTNRHLYTDTHTHTNTHITHTHTTHTHTTHIHIHTHTDTQTSRIRTLQDFQQTDNLLPDETQSLDTNFRAHLNAETLNLLPYFWVWLRAKWSKKPSCRSNLGKMITFCKIGLSARVCSDFRELAERCDLGHVRREIGKTLDHEFKSSEVKSIFLFQPTRSKWSIIATTHKETNQQGHSCGNSISRGWTWCEEY
jgi:hypothetical protein